MKMITTTSFILLALIAPLNAEPTIYGSLRYDLSYSQLQYQKPHENSLGVKADKNHRSSIRSRDSFIGIKGDKDLGNGNELIYKLEWGFEHSSDKKTPRKESHNNHNREAYIGFTGDWGTLLIGRIENPFKQTLSGGSVSDDFYLNQ